MLKGLIWSNKIYLWRKICGHWFKRVWYPFTTKSRVCRATRSWSVGMMTDTMADSPSCSTPMRTPNFNSNSWICQPYFPTVWATAARWIGRSTQSDLSKPSLLIQFKFAGGDLTKGWWMWEGDAKPWDNSLALANRKVIDKHPEGGPTFPSLLHICKSPSKKIPYWPPVSILPATP